MEPTVKSVQQVMLHVWITIRTKTKGQLKRHKFETKSMEIAYELLTKHKSIMPTIMNRRLLVGEVSCREMMNDEKFENKQIVHGALLEYHNYMKMFSIKPLEKDTEQYNQEIQQYMKDCDLVNRIVLDTYPYLPLGFEVKEHNDECDCEHCEKIEEVPNEEHHEKIEEVPNEE